MGNKLKFCLFGSLWVFSFLNPSDCQLTEFADEGPTPTDSEGPVYSFCNTKIAESNMEGGESFELK